MIFGQVELHNVEEVQTIYGLDGVRLQRVPEKVRLALNNWAQTRMFSPACCEIRFVCQAEAQITLSSPVDGISSSQGRGTEVVIFYGSFQDSRKYVIHQEPQTISLAMPARLKKVGANHSKHLPFSSAVFRLMMAGDAVHLHDVVGEGIRRPKPEELPRRRYLAYGTSITHGTAASWPHLSYVSQAARHLDADLINLGVGASAFCEPVLADYIAERKDWDFATLALSVNMVGAGFTPEAFYERVSYMINTVCGANPSRPVACITLFPHFRDFGGQFNSQEDQPLAATFRQKLREAVAKCPFPNAHLIEGPEILTDIAGLAPDLVHPSDSGMTLMGLNLASRLSPILKAAGI